MTSSALPPRPGMSAGRVVQGLAWSSALMVLGISLQFAVMAMLGRLLDPMAFGVFAMASVAARFVSGFATMGGAQVLLQRADLAEGHVTAALGMTLGVSALLFGALAASSPWVAAFFGRDELVAVLLVFGLSVPLGALASLPVALLRRQARFRAAGLIEVVSYALGNGVVGVLLAFRGWGVWSLVVATLAQQAIVAVTAFTLVRPQLTRLPLRSEWQQTFSSGSRFTLIGFLEFLWSNVESMVIGRSLGPAALGVFNRAMALASLPVEQAVNAAGKVVFPALASWQHERQQVIDGFILTLMLAGVISVLLAATIAGAAIDLVVVLLGSRWSEAAPVVTLLAVGVPMSFIYLACGICLDSLAVLRPKIMLQAILLVMKVGLLIWGTSRGVMVMAAILVVSDGLRAAAGLHVVARVLGIQVGRLWQVCAILAALAAVIAAVVQGVGHVAGSLPISVRLPCELLAGLLVGTAALPWIAKLGGDFALLAQALQQVRSIARPGRVGESGVVSS